MSSTMIYAMNSGFSWLIVALAAVGYVATLKRMHQKWPLWVVLALGWAFLATANTLLVFGIPVGIRQLTGLWLSSYVLVAASLLLLFLKLVALAKHQRR